MMGWWRKKQAQAYEKKQRLIRGTRRGAILFEDLIECCDGKSKPIKFFSPVQVLEATDNFSNSYHVFANLIYYEWYSGKNKKHPMILLIEKFTHKLSYYQQEELFCRDIAISSMVSGHKNFLKLVGCCLDSEDVAMVFHGVKKHHQLDLKEQSWRRRMKIAEDIATALAYLHTAFPRPFVYANMKLENILLDEDGVAKLWDFSSCVSIPQGETFVKHKYEWGDTTPRISLYGFMDPNFWKKGLVSEKTDVYGFGILMQKLLSGEQRCQNFFFEKVVKGENETFQSFLPFSLALRFPNWLSKRRMEEIAEPEVLYEEPRFRDLCFDEVEELYYEEAFNRSIVSPIYSPRRFPNWLSESMEEIADPEMIQQMGGISEKGLCQMEDFLMLSQRCVGHIGQVPTMVEVAKELKKIQKSLV